MDQNILRVLPDTLLPWYCEHKRDLPWRQDREPYHIWVSEIMLQQTRVEAVKGYYHRFLQALPGIGDLADCDDDYLHKLWEGLGYYSRVRNLKKAAQVIRDTYGGVFPREYDAVRGLPGVGDYTAGAICSICYDQPTPAVDGNVLRVMARLLNDPSPIDAPGFKREVQRELAQVYPVQAGDFTQALMELGATVCGPNRKPDCPSCPCRDFCLGYAAGTADSLPVKSPKRQRRQEPRTVFILSCEGAYALEKRPDKGLLAGLWQFPNVSGTMDLSQSVQWVERQGLKPREILRQIHRQHIFTHIQWDMVGIYIEVSEPAGGFAWRTGPEIRNEAALPTAFRQFWEEIENV